MNQQFSEFILQWNTRSLVSNWGEFKAYMIKNKPLIAALQETRFLDSDDINYNFRISGYSLYRNNINVTPRRGGTALYVSNHLLHHEIEITTNFNVVAVQVRIAQKDFNILSIYIPPSTNVSYDDLASLFSNIPPQCMIVGDFNAHHRSWGCEHENTRGKHIHKLLDIHDLICINDRTPTHYTNYATHQTHSVIDLALVTPNLAPLFTTQVQSDPLFSDHFPIHIIIEVTSGQTDNNFLPRWNLRKADWSSFKNHIDTVHPPNSAPPIENFLHTITAAAHQHVPHTRRSQGQKHAPWWNDECRRAVAIRRRALRAFKRCICQEHEDAFRLARYQAKRQ